MMMMTAPVNGERVRQAREVRGLRQSELAKMIEVDQSYVSHIESGVREPAAELVERLAFATQFPASFFRRDSGPEFPLGSLLFRRRDSLHSTDRDCFRQVGRLAYEIFDSMAAQFKALEIRVPRLSGARPEEAARLTRTALGLSPDSPITHLINRLERNGVFVLLLPITIQRADGFSVWADAEPRRPVIVLTGGWPGDRQRFSVAHELAHLVLHRAPNGQVSEIDDQADRFASEFLLPSDALRSELRSPVTLTSLAEQKSKWGLPMQMIARSAEKIGIVTAGQRKYLEKQMAFKGWIRNEPVKLAPEKPRLFRKMAETLYGIPTNPARVAQGVSAPPRLVEEVMSAHASKADVMRVREVSSEPKGEPGEQQDKSQSRVLAFCKQRA